MTCRKYKNRATYKTKKAEIRHGMIQYGEDNKGRRKFRIWKTKKGWSVASYSKRR